MNREIDVIGIGCRRSASSFLHECLNSHPSVSKPSRGLHYFSETPNTNCQGYLRLLPQAADHQVLLEYSVSYSYPESACTSAEAIFRCFPEVRLFATIRNPVDRAFSDFLRSQRQLEIPAHLSFEDAIRRYPIFLQRSQFRKIFEPYFERFSKDQIYLLFYDDLKTSISEFLNPFYGFLGVEPGVFPTKSAGYAQRGGQMVFPSFESGLLKTKIFLDSLAERIGKDEAWKRIKQRHLHIYRRARSFNMQRTQMMTSTRKELTAYFHADISWLEAITGRNLEDWR